MSIAQPLANLERFYGELCRASGLACRTKGGLRWYDWLSADQIVRIFFPEWQDPAVVRDDLYPWLLRWQEPVAVISWEPLSSQGQRMLGDAGLEVTLEAWGMELLSEPLSANQVLPKGCHIIEVTEQNSLHEYATLVGSYLTGHRLASSISALARLLESGLDCSIHYLAVLNAAGEIVATTTLYCDDSQACAGIYQVVTLPAYRGQGMASALVARAVELARSLGMNQTILQTAVPAARRIYERIGFRQTVAYRRWTRKEVHL